MNQSGMKTVPGRRSSRYKVLREKHVWDIRGETKSLAYLEESKKGDEQFKMSQRGKMIQNIRMFLNHLNDFDILLQVSWKAIGSILVSYCCCITSNPNFLIIYKNKLHFSLLYLWICCGGSASSCKLLTASVASWF